MWANLGKRIWQWRGVLVTAPSIATLLIGLRCIGLLQPLELVTLDQFFQLRPQEAVDSRIAIVEVNENDVRKVKWPISDAKFAELLSLIKQQKPRVIGLDIYRDLPVEPGHKELVKVFQTTPNLIGIEKAVGNGSGSTVNPPPALKELGQVAANDFILDADGSLRRNLLSIQDNNGETILGLGAMLAVSYLEAQGITPSFVGADQKVIQLGKAVFQPFEANDGGYVDADVGGYQILGNFRNLRQGFRKISMTDVLEGRIPANFLRDRIVLIGVTAESYQDLFLTSYSSNLSRKNALKSSGVTLHADVASQFLSAALDGRSQIKVWSEPLEWLWIFTWSFVGAALIWAQRFSKVAWKIVPFTTASLALLGIILVGGSYLAFLSGWWIPVVPGFIALMWSAITITTYIARSSTMMRQTFGRYLTDEVVNSLLETPQGLKLGGEKRNVTLLMSDLRGFSAISERVSPEKAVEIINLYLGIMTDVINNYNGTINEFIGDGIFVMFGAPIQREDDPQRAIACAIAMQLAMNDINNKLAEMNLLPLEMGIGVHTGEVLAGNIGSQQRAKYTVMGSNVNLASRIESYSVGGQVLVSKITYNLVSSSVRINRQMEVNLKGIQESIKIYEIGGIGGEFNIYLPEEKQDLTPLERQIPVQFKMVEGKHLTVESFQGSLIKLSNTTAEMRSPHPLRLLSNLQISILAGNKRVGGLGDIYAKVVEILDENETLAIVHFTALPPEVSALLYYLRDEVNGC
jgi:adenylate cyclase